MGEFEFLAKFRDRLPSGADVFLGSGDDAAITRGAGATATSVDAVVDGVHFRRGVATPREIGHKALAAALSDLAAMGAGAGEAFVVLGIPPDLDEEGCLEIADGVADVARPLGVAVVGGDATRSPVLFVSITVTGHAPGPEAFVTRAGARPGDILVLTGEIGGASCGLALLDDGADGPDLVAGQGDKLRGRQLRPWPRLEAGEALAQAGATAMIDVSDGLGADAGHLAKASGVSLLIDAAAVPLAPGVEQVARARGRDPLEMALGGGEDYELLAALPPESVGQLGSKAGGVPLTVIGEVEGGEGVAVSSPDGPRRLPRGYDQLD